MTISGSLKYLDSGPIADYWGDGNFLALKFADPQSVTTSIKVGLMPSASSMPLQELDEDMNGVFKITDKDAQKFVISCSNGSSVSTREYDLSGLTCAAE